MIRQRIKITLAAFFLSGLIVIIRLFYWQVLSADPLAALAESQHYSRIEVNPQRGRILSNDGSILVGNQEAYLVYAYLPQVMDSLEEISQQLAPLLFPEEEADATLSAQAKTEKIEEFETQLSAKLTQAQTSWIPLSRRVSKEKKDQIQQLDFDGIGFESEPIRLYPEASTAAHLLGFVGSDINGNPQGYFGLEGFYDLELRGRPGIIRQERDASGKPILVGDWRGFASKNGRDLQLHLDRTMQMIVEDQLEWGLEHYGAKSAEAIVMDPQTGGILALAAFPRYDPEKYFNFDETVYKNPVVAESYEPGSTFKTLTMAAALDAKAVEPDTQCDICAGQIEIGAYTIRTWNEEYRPDINMRQVIQFSDNTGMVFVGQKLGIPKMVDYLHQFGIGQPTGIDLQEEVSPSLRREKDWKEVDLATASFGQGVAVSGIQMLTAVAALANGGQLMEPHIVKSVIGEQEITIKPQVVHQVISEETAKIMTEFMVNAVENGEAQWTKLKGYKIAGKTGTAQIPVAGHYDEEKTIASFVGFAPADNPKFAMLVKLREPSSSPWAAETAAPLWMKIAKQLLFYLGVQPN